MRTIESALAVIRSQGRYLLYHDDDWDCWMLPNLTVGEYSGDADGCLRSLTIDYEMPPWAFDVTGALQVESHKPNPQHDDAVRHYIYTLGFYDLTDTDYQYGCVHNHYLVDIEDWESNAISTASPIGDSSLANTPAHGGRSTRCSPTDA